MMFPTSSGLSGRGFESHSRQTFFSLFSTDNHFLYVFALELHAGSSQLPTTVRVKKKFAPQES